MGTITPPPRPLRPKTTSSMRDFTAKAKTNEMRTIKSKYGWAKRIAWVAIVIILILIIVNL